MLMVLNNISSKKKYSLNLDAGSINTYMQKRYKEYFFHQLLYTCTLSRLENRGIGLPATLNV